MISEQIKLMGIISIALIFFTIGIGIWTGMSGKPYNTALFTVHKLAGLGFAVLAIIATISRIIIKINFWLA